MNGYELPKFKKEKKYPLFRCIDCKTILRMKIFSEDKDKDIPFLFSCNKCCIFEKKYNKGDFLHRFYNEMCFLCSNNIKYICKDCNKNICSNIQCLQIHKNSLYHKNDKFTLEELFDFTCIKHKQNFMGYCFTCNKDICLNCFNEEKENNHNIILYKDIIPTPTEFIKKYNEIETSSDNVIKYILNKKHDKAYTNKEKIDNNWKKNMKIREYLRNFYKNFSRKINQLNFALIYNILENQNIKYINDKEINESLTPIEPHNICFLDNKNFIINFNDVKKMNLMNMIFYSNINYSYLKIKINKNKKFICIIEQFLIKFYNLSTFEFIMDYKLEYKDKVKLTSDNTFLVYDGESVRFLKIDLKSKLINIENTITVLNIDKIKKTKDYLTILCKRNQTIYIYDCKQFYKQINHIKYLDIYISYIIYNDNILFNDYNKVYLFNIKNSTKVLVYEFYQKNLEYIKAKLYDSYVIFINKLFYNHYNYYVYSLNTKQIISIIKTDNCYIKFLKSNISFKSIKYHKYSSYYKYLILPKLNIINCLRFNLSKNFFILSNNSYIGYDNNSHYILYKDGINISEQYKDFNLLFKV